MNCTQLKQLSNTLTKYELNQLDTQVNEIILGLRTSFDGIESIYQDRQQENSEYV